MTHRTVICVLLALVPLIAGCALFNDGQESSPTPRSRPPRPHQQHPHLARHTPTLAPRRQTHAEDIPMMAPERSGAEWHHYQQALQPKGTSRKIRLHENGR